MQKKRKVYAYFYHMEDGVRFTSNKLKYSKGHISYVFQGKNRVHEITDINSNAHVYSIGAYIYYASQIISTRYLKK